jgi:putative DNA primase/helicase
MIIDRVPLRDRARGQWLAILLKSGIDANCLTGKNSPCPMCGGRDRFKFFDSGNNGTWFCRRCRPQGGAGADLIMRFCGLDFREAAKLIERHLAVTTYTKPIKPAPDPRPKLQTMWAASKPVIPGDVVDTYLRTRGVALEQYPPCLRTAPSLSYYDDDATSIFPAMLAAVTDTTGKPVTIHRTYIAPDGCGKARVEKPRKVVSKHGKGPHVRLTPIAPTMGIAEGIETALAATRLFAVPTWSVLSTYGIETFEPPAGLQRLIVFADHDANGAGQKAAHMLAARLAGQIPSEIRFPDTPGDDWNDVLRRR